MLIRPATHGPETPPVCFCNGQVMDVCNPAAQKVVPVKGPILISIGPEPLPWVSVPFIGKVQEERLPKHKQNLSGFFTNLPGKIQRQEIH